MVSKRKRPESKSLQEEPVVETEATKAVSTIKKARTVEEGSGITNGTPGLFLSGDKEVQVKGQKIIAILKKIDGDKRLLSGWSIESSSSKGLGGARSDRVPRESFIDFVLEESCGTFRKLARGLDDWFKERLASLTRLSKREINAKKRESLLRHCSKLRRACVELVKKGELEASIEENTLEANETSTPSTEKKYGLYQSTPNGFVFSNLAKGIKGKDLEKLELNNATVLTIEAYAAPPPIDANESKPLKFRETARRLREKLAVDPIKLQSRSEKPIPRARFLAHNAFQSFAPSFDSTFGFLTPEELAMVWEYRVQGKQLQYLKSNAIAVLRKRVRGWQGKLASTAEESLSGENMDVDREEHGLNGTTLDKELLKQEGIDVDALLENGTEHLNDGFGLDNQYSDPALSLQANAEALIYLQQLQRKRLLAEPTSSVTSGSEEWHLVRRLQNSFGHLLMKSARPTEMPHQNRSNAHLADSIGVAKGSLGHFFTEQGYYGVLPPPQISTAPPSAASNLPNSASSPGRQQSNYRIPSNYQPPAPGGYRGPGRPRIYPAGSTPSSRAAAQRAASHSGSPGPSPAPHSPVASATTHAPLPPIPRYNTQQSPRTLGNANQASPNHFSVPTIPRAFNIPQPHSQPYRRS